MQCFYFSFIPGAVNYTDNTNRDGRSVLRSQRTENLQQPSIDDQEEERPLSFGKLVSNFANSTTAHGVANIAAAKSLPNRMVWLVVTAALYAVLLWMSSELVVRYMNKPVVSRMEMSFEEVNT